MKNLSLPLACKIKLKTKRIKDAAKAQGRTLDPKNPPTLGAWSFLRAGVRNEGGKIAPNFSYILRKMSPLVSPNRTTAIESGAQNLRNDLSIHQYRTCKISTKSSTVSFTKHPDQESSIAHHGQDSRRK
jgi:hypothetical protein